MPNNWQFKFGGSAWELMSPPASTSLHPFAREQADSTGKTMVRAEVKTSSTSGPRRVDGFRLDVINLISKNQAFPDDEGMAAASTPTGRIHEFCRM